MTDAGAGILLRRLGFIATVLGVTAAVTGSPYASDHAHVDIAALGRAVVHEEDHVTAVDLARWIRDRRTNLRLLDVRSRAEYDAYHIPTAEWVALDSVAETRLKRDETIVIYSEGGAHAAQAWVFLRALGFENVYFLRGGLLDWLDDVMSPTLGRVRDAHRQHRIRHGRAAQQVLWRCAEKRRAERRP